MDTVKMTFQQLSKRFLECEGKLHRDIAYRDWFSGTGAKVSDLANELEAIALELFTRGHKIEPGDGFMVRTIVERARQAARRRT